MALTEPTAAGLPVATTIEVVEGPGRDPLAWLDSSPAGVERWFWEIPDDDSSWVGIGSVSTASVAGPDRFSDAAEVAADMLDGLVVDAPDEAPLPRLAAGFAFETGGGEKSWRELGGGRLVLPALQVLRQHGRTWVTSIGDQTVPIPHKKTSSADYADGADASRWATDEERSMYRHLVATALKAIAGGEITKAVPCRSIRVDRSPDLPRLLATLRETFPACATFCVDTGRTVFAGATPERLAAVHNGHLDTAALAGSAPRHADTTIDDALGQGLMTSPKEQNEHAVVVDAVVDSLECLHLTPLLPNGPALLRLHGIQHLHTPISCELPDGVGILDVVGALHPTPAVSGAPIRRAIELRGLHEHLDRGWFAGPVGWLDADGNGEFRVALRSALIDDLGTTLFAGAGVVAGSDPERELLETEVKLGAMLGPVLATSGVPEGIDR
ncbi:MAG: hypothetical protein CL393_02085 [Acidiferrobacteraceae bacterium]|jgi:isochorismate synthase|nr:hypothetical protein [Acidiferrobacteraceae bacterium]MDP6062890.1 isochorismate synthase [Acidimicrobiales bacterium]HJO99688.1 isochorismate synthase [Acidimicrobiales bacterium]|tara:strand:+ start:3970 stop:5295 length:1326 start_codon:yes stop_codon:yes gene_type:complete